MKHVPNQSTLKEKQWKSATDKYLGMFFDIRLNWKENINSMLKKSELENVLLDKAEIFGSQFR